MPDDNSPALLFTRTPELPSLYPGYPFSSVNVPDLGFKEERPCPSPHPPLATPQAPDELFI